MTVALPYLPASGSTPARRNKDGRFFSLAPAIEIMRGCNRLSHQSPCVERLDPAHIIELTLSSCHVIKLMTVQFDSLIDSCGLGFGSIALLRA